MPARLRERLDARSDAEAQAVMAKTSSEGSLYSQSPTSFIVPPAAGEQSSIKSNFMVDTLHTTRTVDDVHTETDRVEMFGSDSAIERAPSPSLHNITTEDSLAVAPLPVDALFNAVSGVTITALGPVTSASSADLTSQQANAADAVHNASVKTLSPGDSIQIASRAPITDATEQRFTEPFRKNPKRAAAKKAAGFYAGTEVEEIGVGQIPGRFETASAKRTSKRKRGEGSRKKTGCSEQNEAGARRLVLPRTPVETRRRSKTSIAFHQPGREMETRTTEPSPGTKTTRTSERVLPKDIQIKSSHESLRPNKKMRNDSNVTSNGGPVLEHSTMKTEFRKKRKLVRIAGTFTNRYKIRFGWTPFPNNTRPFQKICHNVFKLLKKHHENEVTLEKYRDELRGSAPGGVQGPMHAGQEVTFDAIVRTILSQATNNDNAQTVEQSLIHRFQHEFLGTKLKGKSPNYHAIRTGLELDLAKALASGGLQHMKAKSIKGCLDVVYAENMARATEEERLNAEKVKESVDFVPGMLSLDYMLPMGLQEKFDHLVNMPGIGVKTAACILAFNFEYPLFAVDTHVMRLSRMLRWLPLNARSENHAFMHLNYRVPNELKYGLHQAFWHHGQYCVRCQAGTNEKSKGWKDTQCPIEDLVDRSRKDPHKSKKPKSTKNTSQDDKQRQDEDKDAPKPKRVKKQPHVLPYAKLTIQMATELGYELRAIVIDDAFGVRRANRNAEPLLKWVLVSDHDATENPDGNTMAE